MMWKIAISEDDYTNLRSHLLASTDEAAAVLFCGASLTEGGGRLLVRSAIPAPLEGLVYHHSGAVSVRPEWLAGLVKKAKAQGLTLAIVHSHPFSTTQVRFSSIDTSGQACLLPALRRRIPSHPLCELVFGQESIDGLIWQARSERPVPLTAVTIVGRKITTVMTSRAPVTQDPPTSGDIYDRQALIWGEVGQRHLRSLKIGVVGAGGNGSWVCAQLIHLGIGTVVVVDHDKVEASNRSRLIGSTDRDVVEGTSKVRVVQRYAEEHNADVLVIPIEAKVESMQALKALKDCDIFVGCTDTYASRNVLNNIAIRYLIPLIDTGVEVEIENKGLRTFAARIAYVLPGGPCLRCAGFLTEPALSAEAAREQRGYVPGVASPSVAALNALAASMAAVDVLQIVHGLLGGLPLGDFKAYSGRSGEVRRCAMGPRHCGLCEELYARGDFAAEGFTTKSC